jgi:hypothetical protein
MKGEVMKSILALMVLAVATFWVVKDSKNVVVDNATVEIRSCHCGKGSKLIAKFGTADMYASCINSDDCLDIKMVEGEPTPNYLNAVEKCKE